MRDETTALVERAPFLAGMTALGGFCNAYTCMTRGGVFANAHTANMAKLGVSLATLDYSGAVGALVPILGCLAGAFLCECVKERSAASPRWLGGHWHRKAMVLELLALLLVGFIPSSAPNAAVNAFMSLVTGFQLNLFRNWKGGGHNTTICTGNLRTVAQLLYAALARRDAPSGKKLLTYTGLFFSFSLGALLSTLLCLQIGVRASWGACLFLAVWLLWMFLDERKGSGAVAG